MKDFQNVPKVQRPQNSQPTKPKPPVKKVESDEWPAREETANRPKSR